MLDIDHCEVVVIADYTIHYLPSMCVRERVTENDVPVKSLFVSLFLLLVCLSDVFM